MGRPSSYLDISSEMWERAQGNLEGEFTMHVFFSCCPVVGKQFESWSLAPIAVNGSAHLWAKQHRAAASVA